MKSKIFAVIGVSLLFVMVLTACGSGNQQVAEPTPAEQQLEGATAVLTDAPVQTEAQAETKIDPTKEIGTDPKEGIDMEALIEEKVDGHHDLGRVFNATKTRAEWEQTIDRMIGYGADINDQEKEMIIDYLLSRQSN